MLARQIIGTLIYGLGIGGLCIYADSKVCIPICLIMIGHIVSLHCNERR